jgi:hypothetical protein
MAHTFVDNRKPYRRMGFHTVHLPPFAEKDKRPWMAQFYAAETEPPGRYLWNVIGPPLTASDTSTTLTWPACRSRSALAGDFA